MINTNIPTALISILALTFTTTSYAQDYSQDPVRTRADEILDRFINANAHRDHVMVVAHRGGGRSNDRADPAENSLSAIEHAIEIGVEMVELDVRRTVDGSYIILHDETLDRTTTCNGTVAEMPLDEVQKCQLVFESGNRETQESVPTLEEALSAIKGRILVNLDLKFDAGEIADIAQIADMIGVSNHVLIKRHTETADEIEATQIVLKKTETQLAFMPILDDRDLTDVQAIEATYSAFSPEAIETINRWETGTPITVDGGLNFSLEAWVLAYKNDAHLWVDVLSQRGAATLSGGRGDAIAVTGNLAEEGWGFWVRAGATILQTDEPEALIEYLESQGYRQPYN